MSSVVISGVLAAVALTLLILLVSVLADLLSSGGSISLPAGQSTVVGQWGVAPTEADIHSAHYQQCGLLPTVWRLQNTPVGAVSRALFISWPVLHSNQGSLAVLIVGGWILALVAAAALYWLAWSVERAAVQVAEAVREQIHSQAHRLGASDLFVGRKTTATDLFFERTGTLRAGLAAWRRVFPHAVCFAVLMLALALAVDFWLTLTTLLLSAFGWRLFSELRYRARHRAGLLNDRAADIAGQLREPLGQNRLLGNLTMETRSETGSFSDDLQHYNATMLARETTASVVGPLVMLFVMVVAGFVLMLAGFNVLREPPRLSFASIVLLSTSLMALAYPLVCFERLLERLPGAEHAAEEIFTYLDREPLVGQLPAAAPLERLSRQIKLDRVTLADMTGRPRLDDVSVVLPAGRQTVLFCSDDDTPMAFAGILSRFCDPAAGQVLFDGRDLREATLESVRRQVALVLPDHVLVSGTLRANIVGDDSRFTTDEIIEATKTVHAYEFIQSLPEGLETLVGTQGISLSAGQAIRVGLARVVLRKPSVVVIEEPRDDLDQVTAERVADALERVTQDCTLVILARRLAALRNAQRILLFHEGRLLADGTHQDLLQHNDLYRHMNYVRFNEFRDKLR
jgi:ATP-binding cassette, subfamily B, bacterial